MVKQGHTKKLLIGLDLFQAELVDNYLKSFRIINAQIASFILTAYQPKMKDFNKDLIKIFSNIYEIL